MKKLAPLTDSTSLIGDGVALRKRWKDDGVLYFHNVMDPERVVATSLPSSVQTYVSASPSGSTSSMAENDTARLGPPSRGTTSAETIGGLLRSSSRPAHHR